jgi:hypothetical protein
MRLRWSEFEFLLHDCTIYAGFSEVWWKEAWAHRGAVLIAKDIMAELWLRQLAETPNTLELRNQISHLHTSGTFDLHPDN